MQPIPPAPGDSSWIGAAQRTSIRDGRSLHGSVHWPILPSNGYGRPMRRGAQRAFSTQDPRLHNDIRLGVAAHGQRCWHARKPCVRLSACREPADTGALNTLSAACEVQCRVRSSESRRGRPSSSTQIQASLLPKIQAPIRSAPAGIQFSPQSFVAGALERPVGCRAHAATRDNERRKLRLSRKWTHSRTTDKWTCLRRNRR
jgi:hypothetical protein